MALPTMPQARSSTLPQVDQAVVARWKESLEDGPARRQLAKLLARVPIFSESPEAFRLALCQVLVPMEYYAGQVIFRQGELGDWAGFVIQGRLERRLLCDPVTGEMRKVGELAPGNIIGDMGLLGISETRRITAVTSEPTTLLLLTRTDLEELVASCGGPVEQAMLQAAAPMRSLIGAVESFCNLECFRRLDRDFVMALCEQLEPRLLYQQQIMMRENLYGNEMYILHEGQVKVEKDGKFLVQLPGGVVLGELAVLGSDKRRTATVTCTRLCLVWVLHGDVFHEILDKFPVAKKTFDHEYIARLCSFELSKVRDEINHLNSFYGRAHPMTRLQVMEQVYGHPPAEKDARSRTSPRAARSPRKPVAASASVA